jgi:beta-lactamase superfamily II metal-dependent hydrolase
MAAGKKAAAKKRAATRKTAPGKAVARKTGAGKVAKGNGDLRVRMYRVGFGDFFLVTVPSAHGPQHILIDCGVTPGTTHKGDIGTIKSAVRHMAAETNRTLALIIVTHRHQDHIIGFSRCEDVFKQFKVGAIWMSAWETEYPAKVARLQAALLQQTVRAQAQLALRAAGDPVAAAVLGVLENATGEGPGGGTNAKSLEMLKTKMGVKPKYLHRGQKAPLPDALAAAGLEAEILGPPPVDRLAFMKLEDLTKHVGQYLGAAAAGAAGDDDAGAFGAHWRVEPAAYPAAAFREWAPRPQGQLTEPSPLHAARVEKAIAASQPEALAMAAKELDDFLNNQSLVVLFTWKGKRLLFAGDAQAGNWEFWLFDLDQPSKKGLEALTTDSASILGGLDFYKVGHHGSTNATPIAAVTGMSQGFAAMCSTQIDTYGSLKNESEVPRLPLIEALEKKCQSVVRSDHHAFDFEGKKVAAVAGARAALPKPKRGGRFVVGSCFVDYLL